MSYQKNIKSIIENVDLNQPVSVYQLKYNKREVMHQYRGQNKNYIIFFLFGHCLIDS